MILTIAALAGLLCQGPPILFTQQRIGRHGKPFRLVKLRTMAGPPGQGRAYRERHRLTRYGRILRQLRLDELPQILHLLTGAMSLVGPRPLLAQHLIDAGGGGRRHDVRPGFTCYAQLELVEHGYLDKHHQISLDEAYVEHVNLRTDLGILSRTAIVLTTRKRHRQPIQTAAAPLPEPARGRSDESTCSPARHPDETRNPTSSGRTPERG